MSAETVWDRQATSPVDASHGLYRRMRRNGTVCSREEESPIGGRFAVRSLIKRHSDPANARHAVISITKAGLSALSDKCNTQIAQVARMPASEFTPTEPAS